MKNRNDHGGNIYQEGINKDKVVDFSSNINPMDLPKDLYESLESILNKAKNYPDIEYKELKKAVADYLNKLMDKEILAFEDIVLGNGATELIEASALLSENALIPIPSFYEYQRACMKSKTSYTLINKYERGVPEEENLKYNKEDFYELLDKNISSHDSVFLCNPNNPDGSSLKKDSIEKILQKYSDKIFIIDETFGEYLDKEDMILPLIEKYENLIVIKALTKFFGLPGLRLGYAISKNREIIDKMNSYLPVWNINTFSEEVAKIMFKEEEYIKNSIELNYKRKDYLIDELKKIGIFTRVYESSSDFIMVKYEEDDRFKLENFLKNKNILIRNLDNMEGLEKGFFRIAIKEEEKTDILVKALIEYKELKK